MNKCCIVIPSYKEKLEGNDKLSFDRCIEIFGKNRPIKVVIPSNISTDFYDSYGSLIEIVRVDGKNMESVNSYSNMLCNKDFWNLFTDFEYILIYQTDCWVFEDKLDYFIEMGYDWYGAPWPFWNNQVGNGGLSLRKVSKMIEIVNSYSYDGKIYFKNEDTWFCKIHGDKMNICPYEIAVNFSLERVSVNLLEKIETKPMGFHGKDLIKLWDDDGTKFFELKKKYIGNIDIFICTHKDFEKVVSNPYYKVINAKDINGDVAENGLKGSFYSEILLYFNVAKNYPLKDYVGFCHYRKYFSFMDNVPDMDDFFKNYDALVVKPLKFNSSIKEQYATYHNVEDLEIVENIIANKFPEYYNAANFFFNKCTEMFPCNMFIMKKNDFIKYTEFIKGVLDEYVNIVGTDIEKRIEDNKDKYLKDLEGYPQNKEPWYQYRIGGYLAERLTNVFVLEHFRKIGVCEMIETEKKY